MPTASSGGAGPGGPREHRLPEGLGEYTLPSPPRRRPRGRLLRAAQAALPLDVNVQFMTVMATRMPFIGRG